MKAILFSAPKPKLSLTVKVSKGTTLVLTLLDSKGHKLAGWAEREKTGVHKLSLLLPSKARHPAHDRLRITETGNSTPKTLPVTLRG